MTARKKGVMGFSSFSHDYEDNSVVNKKFNDIIISKDDNVTFPLFNF